MRKRAFIVYAVMSALAMGPTGWWVANGMCSVPTAFGYYLMSLTAVNIIAVFSAVMIWLKRP